MDLRVIEIDGIAEAAAVMRAMSVHKGGIDVMAPKAFARVIKVSGIDSVALNILKQDMLSLGGDCAVAWDAFIKRKKNAGGLIIGTVSQIERLCEKLKRQPLGLPALANSIRELLAVYDKYDFILRAGRYRLNLGRRAHIMGIVNVTPDSFSDGGALSGADDAVERALELESQGADIIDVGGESTRPGAKAVGAKEECARVIPVIKALSKKIRVPVSIDTSKSEVAERALDCGASVINDITGFRQDRRGAGLAKRYKAAVVLMHMKGNPRTMQKAPRYKDLIGEITGVLRKSVEIAKGAGIGDDRIVIDPGIGFGKTAGHNLEILRRLREFKSLGYPILVGPSRKSFIGKITGADIADRVFGTAAASAVAVTNGANIVRVHDVREIRQALQITEAVKNAANI